MGAFGISQPVRRTEDPIFLTGQGRYVDDIKLDDTLHAFVLRSPHAHANINSIDISRAAAAPGVHLVLTGADYEAAGLGAMPYNKRRKPPNSKLRSRRPTTRPTVWALATRRLGRPSTSWRTTWTNKMRSPPSLSLSCVTTKRKPSISAPIMPAYSKRLGWMPKILHGSPSAKAYPPR